MDHCPYGAHSDHENRIARMEKHCNGDHVTRHEVNAMSNAIEKNTVNNAKLIEQLGAHMEDEKIEAARRDSTTKLLVALVGALTVIVPLLLAHFTK